MSDDATFEDGRARPVNIGALDAQDVEVLSALVQDAIFPISEISWGKTKRRFAVLLNRFRWEDSSPARHAPERVQSVLLVDHVLSVASQGVDPSQKDLVLSLLSVAWVPDEEGAGQVLLTLAGDGAIRLDVEALEIGLRDVTRPYQAPSGKAPQHDL